VYSEQAYVITVGDDKWAAPYRTDIVVRAGKPVEGVNFVLGRATRLHGRVTAGKDARPVAQTYIVAMVFEQRELPAELQRKGSRFQGVSMQLGTYTDKDGRFELHLGPGVYMLNGPDRTQPLKITIPPDKPPAEIVQDFRLPRPVTGPLDGRVIDTKGRPVAGANVDGHFTNSETRSGFAPVKTDAQGRFQVERSLDTLVLHARSADGTRAGIARVAATAKEAQITIRGPLASESGRPLDLDGKPLAKKKLDYGMRIYADAPEENGFRNYRDCFGGTVETDAKGRFTLTGLIPGQAYYVSRIVNEGKSVQMLKEVKPKGPGAIDLGDLRVENK